MITKVKKMNGFFRRYEIEMIVCLESKEQLHNSLAGEQSIMGGNDFVCDA